MNSHAVLTRLTHGTGKKSATPESLPACLNCDQPYVPKKKDQKFCSDRCRIKNWNFKTAGQRAIADLQKENAAILARLERAEAWIADFEKNLSKACQLGKVNIHPGAIL